jgi:hypothetical protein
MFILYLHWIHLDQDRAVVGSCVRSNEPSGAINEGHFLNS